MIGWRNMKTVNSTLEKFSLEGRTALVTGGNRGLGLAIAAALYDAGATLVITARDEAQLANAKAGLLKRGAGVVHTISNELTDDASVTSLYDSAHALVDSIDILINNAGVNRRGPAENLTEDDWHYVLQTDLTVPFLVARTFARPMLQRGWGRILNVGSIFGQVAFGHRVPYGAAKAGIIHMSKVMAVEWATRGVTVNALCPGPFATEMNKVVMDDPEQYQRFVGNIPMARWGNLEEIGAPALLLCSDAGSFITGTTLTVDGGWTAQ
jgi:NAD(P)-dependent dehydrogenase (short-subunit alcohol dehydrogenase family)